MLLKFVSKMSFGVMFWSFLFGVGGIPQEAMLAASGCSLEQMECPQLPPGSSSRSGFCMRMFVQQVLEQDVEIIGIWRL